MGYSLSRWARTCGAHASIWSPNSDENVQLVSELVEVDRNVTIRQLEQDTGLAHSTVLHILKDLLKMRNIASKWVPHNLTDMHKWQRCDASRMHLQRYHPYSPDLSPCDYDLIPKMKMPMRGKRYSTIEDVKQAAARSLRTISRLGSANGIQRLPRRVAGNTLYTTVGTTSRAYETWNHLGELFIQL